MYLYCMDGGNKGLLFSTGHHHTLHHMVEGMEHFGPVYGTWMFPFERFKSWMCRRAVNRFRPEATIMETYRVQ